MLKIVGAVVELTANKYGMLRYSKGKKYCKNCQKSLEPGEYHISKSGFGTFCDYCGHRVRSFPRHSKDRVKYIENVIRL